MATYKYRITDKFGRDKKGTLEAGSPEAATAKLKGEGAVVHSVEETTSVEDASWNITIGNPVKLKDITLSKEKIEKIKAEHEVTVSKSTR